MHILGISAFYHDSAACLLKDGEILAAAQEERFTRKKYDPGFPSRAVDYCLNAGNIKVSDLSYIVFYSFAPKGLRSFLMAMPLWMKEKLFLKKLLIDQFNQFGSSETMPTILFGEHHESHAASALRLTASRNMSNSFTTTSWI